MTDSRKRTESSGTAGFTLIEMLCALSILALCLTGIAQLCTEATRASIRADQTRAATEFLEALSADLILSTPRLGFVNSEWVRKAAAKGWKLDIQRTAHPDYTGLVSVSVCLTIPPTGRQIRLTRMIRGFES